MATRTRRRVTLRLCVFSQQEHLVLPSFSHCVCLNLSLWCVMMAEVRTFQLTVDVSSLSLRSQLMIWSKHKPSLLAGCWLRWSFITNTLHTSKDFKWMSIPHFSTLSDNNIYLHGVMIVMKWQIKTFYKSVPSYFPNRHNGFYGILHCATFSLSQPRWGWVYIKCC